MTFDTSMAQVAATMGKTVDEIQELRDYALEMGSKTAFSASQAADALNYMALAGYDADTSMAMLPNVLNLAAAGGIDLAYASDMITDSQSALGLTLDETAELVDKMAKASSKSNTSVAQLGEAILTVGGTAKTLAGGTTELSTALGILADNGVKGAEGGTALRNIILSLSAPTDKAAGALADLGVEVFDAAGNMRPLNETFSDLDKALSTMTQGEQTQVLNQIFNKVDLKSVNALLSNTNERFDELSGYIDEASGAAAAMADTQLDTLAGDITLFKSALEGAQITLSDQLTPTLRQFVQFGADGIGKITDAFKEGGLNGAMDALGGVLSDGITMITEMLPTVIEAGIGLVDALVDGISNNIEPLTNAALKIGLKLIDGIGQILPKLVTAGLTIIKTLAQGISKNIKTVVSTVTNVIIEIAKALTNPNTLSDILNAGLQIVIGLAQGILEAIPEIIEALPEIIDNIVTFIIEAIPMIIDAGVQLLTALVDNLPRIISSIVEVLPQLITGIVDGLMDNIDKIIQAGIDLLVALVSDIPKIISEIVKAIPKIIKGLTEDLLSQERIEQMIATGVTLFASLISNIPEILKNIGKGIADIIDGVSDAFAERIVDMIEVGKQLAEGIAKGFNQAKDWVVDKASEFADNWMTGIRQIFGIHSPSKLMQDEIGKNLALGLGMGFEDEMKDVSKDMTNAIPTEFNTSVKANVGVDYDYARYIGKVPTSATIAEQIATIAGQIAANVNSAGGGAANAGQNAVKQPLIVIMQIPSGVEVGRQYIEDINMAKRADGSTYI
ncbi:MAG: phage tail tape measure protein [Oscillospiraceae bacterium]|nr:phage tail tape measure protein [Oscillospiraceae bacterium]